VVLELCAADDVRTAHRELMTRLPRATTPQPPSLDVLRAPIWSTWARFKMDVDQTKVEAFADEIVAHDFPRSHMEVDDKWSTKYGDVAFDATKFPEPRAMVSRLRRRGFTVTLWVTPFAEPSSEAYAEGHALGYWLKAADGSGEPAVVTWWQGEGVLLNVSDRHALDWMERRLRGLMAATGIAGFKFDAGEASFVPRAPSGTRRDANEYCGAWARFAARFGGGGEVRCAGATQGVGLWTREFDKDSRWSHHNGLKALLVTAMQLGVLGYPFVLPDMVGGNAYSDAMLAADDGTDASARSAAVEPRAGDDDDDSRSVAPPPPAVQSSLFFGNLPDRELYVRWCQANALLPAVQFSIAPWQYDEAATAACKRALVLRAARLPLLEELAARALSDGEPIAQPLWYHFPHDPTCMWIDDQFMLGNATLVAPVLDAGATSRPVYLPLGRWVSSPTEREYNGPAWVEHPVPFDEVAVFDRR